MKPLEDFRIIVTIECPRNHKKLKPVVKRLQKTLWKIGRLHRVNYSITNDAKEYTNEKKE